MNIINDVLRLVIIQDDCWVFTGKQNKGYAAMMFYPFRHTQLHRNMYEYYYNEDIPKGLQIDHICGNKLCINPKHLRSVSASENLLNAFGNSTALINSRKTECKRGHKFNSENTYIDKYGRRTCIKCKLERDRINNGWYKFRNLPEPSFKPIKYSPL